MKFTRTFILFATFFCCFKSIAQPPTFNIKGRVINESNGKPLAAASIAVIGAKKGTVTDVQGLFSIKLLDDKKQYKIAISFTGFITKELSVKAGEDVVIKLTEDIKDEGEVIIQTGYGGGIKKKELAASVSTVGAKELKDIPINSVGEALNGRLAGVTATTSEGSPDADIRVRVRGGGSITQDNSPLYVIDGVIVENGLNNVVLQDIQDITVLKDAAATALYGARGANGVIVITTKSGKTGKIKVSYNTYFGFKTLPKTLDVMKTNDFVMYLYERSRAGSSQEKDAFAKNFVSTFDSVLHFEQYKAATPVNWQKEVMGNTGYTQQHNLSLSGGTKKFNYNGGYTFQDDKAIILNSTYKRHQVNTKFEYKFNSKLKMGLSARYTNQNVFGAGTSETGVAFNRLRQSIRYQPFLLPGETLDNVDPDEDIGGAALNLSLINPIKLNRQEFKRKTTNAFNVTTSLTYTFNKHFTFKSTFGIDNSLLETRTFNDSITSFSTIQNGRNPIIGFDSLQRKSWVNSNTLTYTLKNYKGKHDIEILLGQEWRQLKTVSVNHQSRDVKRFAPRDSLFSIYNTLKEDVGFGVPNKFNESGASFFTRIGYTYNKKYIFNFVLRADGSSKFIDENKWGFFPSASVAWRASEEKFLSKNKFIKDLKFRAGIGENGNSRIGDYLYSSVFNPNSNFYGLNGNAVTAYTIAQLANQKIKWESVINRNLGVDFTILKKRLDISLDYYYNTSKDLLLNTKIAPTFGFSEQIQNIGKTRNSGFELQLNANILQSKTGLNWTSNFNISFNKNEIVELNYGNQIYPVEPSWYAAGFRDYQVKVGEPLGAMYGFVTDGFYKVNDFDYDVATQVYKLKKGVVDNKAIGVAVQPGSIKFKDLDGNGTVENDDTDRKVIGNANAKFTGGLNQQFTYKNFDASIFLNFSYGNNIYNANKIEFTNGYVNYSNLLATMNNRWKTINANGDVVTDPNELETINKDATLWKPLASGNPSFFTHSWAVEDGSFLRINNITIGYSMPIKTLARLGISRFRIYVTGNNLAVFSKYTGYDPEVSVKKSGLTPGLDYSAYPRSRSIIFGLNVNF